MEGLEVEFVLRDVEVKRKERDLVEVKLKVELEKLVKDLLFEEDLEVFFSLVKYYFNFFQVLIDLGIQQSV